MSHAVELHFDPAAESHLGKLVDAIDRMGYATIRAFGGRPHLSLAGYASAEMANQQDTLCA